MDTPSAQSGTAVRRDGEEAERLAGGDKGEKATLRQFWRAMDIVMATFDGACRCSATVDLVELVDFG